MKKEVELRPYEIWMLVEAAEICALDDSEKCPEFSQIVLDIVNNIRAKLGPVSHRGYATLSYTTPEIVEGATK